MKKGIFLVLGILTFLLLIGYNPGKNGGFIGSAVDTPEHLMLLQAWNGEIIAAKINN